MSNVQTSIPFSSEYEPFARRKWFELHQSILSSQQEYHQQQRKINGDHDTRRGSDELSSHKKKALLCSPSPDDLLHVMLLCASQISAKHPVKSTSSNSNPLSLPTSGQACASTDIQGEAHYFWSIFPSSVSWAIGNEVRVSIGGVSESPDHIQSSTLFDSPLHLLLPSQCANTTFHPPHSSFTFAMDRACSSSFTAHNNDHGSSAKHEETNFIKSVVTTVLGPSDELETSSITHRSPLTSISLTKLPTMCLSKRIVFYAAVLGLLSRTDGNGLAVGSGGYANGESDAYRQHFLYKTLDRCTSVSIGRCCGPISGHYSEKCKKESIKLKNRRFGRNGDKSLLYRYEDGVYGGVPERIRDGLIPCVNSYQVLESAASIIREDILECVKEVVGNNDKYFVFEEECCLIVVSMFEDSEVSSMPFPLSSLSHSVTSLSSIEPLKYEDSGPSGRPTIPIFLSSISALVGPILYACGASLINNIRSYSSSAEGGLLPNPIGGRSNNGSVGTRHAVTSIYPIQLMCADSDSSILLYPLDYHICNSQYIAIGNSHPGRHDSGVGCSSKVSRQAHGINSQNQHFVKEAYLLNRALYLGLWRPLQHPTIELLSTCILFERLLLRRCGSSINLRSSSITIVHYCFSALKTSPLLVVFPWLVTAFGGSSLPPGEVLQLWDWVMVLHIRHQQTISKMSCPNRVEHEHENVSSAIIISPIYSLLAVAAAAIFELRMDLIYHIPGRNDNRDVHGKGSRAIVTSRKELIALYRTDMSSILLVPLIERYLREFI